MPRRLTIGAFSRRSGLSISALRFYDRAGLLPPAEVDATTGYRLYDESQLPEAELIRDLRRLEMSLPDIQSFLCADASVRHKALFRHLEHKSAELRLARNLASQLRARIDHYEEQRPMSTMTVDLQDLAEAIDQITPAASTDPEMPLLHTVLIEARDGSLRFVATDRYRLAVRDLVARGDDGASFRAVVARAGLERIGRTLGRDRATVDVRHDGGALVIGEDAQAGRLTVMPAEFPAYEKLFVLDPAAHSAIVERTPLAAILQAAGDRAVAKVTLEPGRVRVDGEPASELPAVYEGPELTVGLHPAFAHYAVDAAVGPEVMIEITTPLRPVVFRSATDSSYICMVMPIKLDAS